MSLLAHSRMCKESDRPCRRIAEGIGSWLKINGPLYRQKGMIRGDASELGNIAVQAGTSQRATIKDIEPFRSSLSRPVNVTHRYTPIQVQCNDEVELQRPEVVPG
jgi:hypothetical protein